MVRNTQANIILSLFTCVLLVSINSCKARSNVSSVKDTTGDDLTSSETYDPIVDDPSNPLLTDLEPITKMPRMNLKDDSDASVMSTAGGNPHKYGLTKSSPPEKFAGATVLAAMRRLRRYYNTVPFKANAYKTDVVTIPYGRGPKEDSTVFPNLTGYVPKGVDKGNKIWNFDGAGSMGSNMGAMPNHWSDIQAHFYILAPHSRHGCWTIVFGAIMGQKILDWFEPGKPVNLEEIRQEALRGCTGQKTFRADIKRKGYLASQISLAFVYQMSAYNLLWVDPGKRQFIDYPEDIRLGDEVKDYDTTELPNLGSVKWANEQRSKGYINVWDYIMLGQTYAWDYEQQTSVLNAFYGDHKKYSGDAALFDPMNKSECSRYRPVRPSERDDGTQCDYQKTIIAPLMAVGR